MKQDFLLEIMKNDELASEFKKSVLDQIVRDAARKKLKAKRKILRDRLQTYENRVNKTIEKIAYQLNELNSEENELYKIVDMYNEEVEEVPHITEEAIELLIIFMKEYKKRQENE